MTAESRSWGGLMDDWLTVGEVEQQTRIPERTIRRYLGLHGHHIQTRKQGRSVLVAGQAVSILKQIRDWYDAGWNAARVEEALSESGLPVTVTIDGHETAMTAAEALQELQKSVATAMAAMAAEMAELRQEVAASREETARLRQFIDERLEERDRQLTQTLRMLLEQRQEEAQARKKGWWPWRKT